MPNWLRQSTSVDVPIGPFLDATDGVTAQTGLTITQPDVRLKKNGGNWAQKAAAQTLTHEENGWYEVTLDGTDTDTLGRLLVAVHESGARPVRLEFMVIPANVYDSMVIGSDLLDVNLAEVAPAAVTSIRSVVSGTSDGGTTTTMVDAARTESDTDYWRGAIILFTSGNLAGQCRRITAFTPATDTLTFTPATTQAVGTHTYEIHRDALSILASLTHTGAAVQILAGGIGTTAMAANSMHASALAADALAEIQAGLATQASLDTLASYVDTEIASIISSLSALAARIPATLTADGNMKADALRISGTVQTAGDVPAALTMLGTRLPAALSSNGNIKSDTREVNNIVVGGSGTEEAPWGPAA